VGALALHVADIIPAEPPHGTTSPRLAEGVGIAGSSVSHRDDGLSAASTALTQGTLSSSQISRFDADATVDFHRAIPLQGTSRFGRWWWRRSGFGLSNAGLSVALQNISSHARTTSIVSSFVAVVIATTSRVGVAWVYIANGLLSGALVSHLVDIPPIPPPHRSTAPPFGQRVGISGPSVGHGNDGLPIVSVSAAETTLSVTQIRRPRHHATILRHGAEPTTIRDSSAALFVAVQLVPIPTRTDGNISSFVADLIASSSGGLITGMNFIARLLITCQLEAILA